jgi:hypothetical protein
MYVSNDVRIYGYFSKPERVHEQKIVEKHCFRPVFNRRAAARYRALALIIPGRERPEETKICYKI